MTYSLLLRIDQWQGRLVFVARTGNVGTSFFVIGVDRKKRVYVSSVSRTWSLGLLSGDLALVIRLDGDPRTRKH